MAKGAVWPSPFDSGIKRGAGVADKALDYYMNGLPIEVRQTLFYHMKTEISGTMIRWFLEKEDGYPSFRSCGFSDDEIELIGETYVVKFEHANQIMACSATRMIPTSPLRSTRSS